jgi:hypothetical protein
LLAINRPTLLAMSAPTARVDATSTAFVVHSHANLYPDLSIAFDLRRLPAELREKVFEQAALASSGEQRRRLLTVSREFYQVTAPHAWEVSRPLYRPVSVSNNNMTYS